MNDRVKRGDGDNKKLAFLMDARTIGVMDFVTSNMVAVVNHDAKIDWHAALPPLLRSPPAGWR